MSGIDVSVERLYGEHVNPAFVRLLGVYGYGRVMTRGQGLELFDDKGRRYLDFLAGFGTTALGHNHDGLLDGLRRALGEGLPHVLHTGPQSWTAELAAALAKRVPHLPMCLMSLSGGEAVEAALKLARAATGRGGLVYANGGFHGTGMGNLSVMGHARWKKPFQPLLPECHAVPFGDADAVSWAIGKYKPAALLLEPIQAEAGVVMPGPDFLMAAQRACREAGTLFILDEVQTGLGRTGKLFAFEHTPGLEPDVLVLGKALGAGLLPVSATLTTRKVLDAAYGSMTKFDLHGSTYAGYALGSRVAMTLLTALDEPGMLERVRLMGDRLRKGLSERLEGHPFVREVRGSGLLVGLELGPSGRRLLDRVAPAVTALVTRQVLGQWLAVRLLEEGFVCQPASQEWNVLKLTPPLTVDEAAIDAFVGAAGKVLDEYRDFAPLLADVTRRLARQAKNGGLFG